MKEVAVLIAMVIAVGFADAQSGLQFNQVVLSTAVVAGTSGSTATVGTVPSGKVWKIENIWSDGDIYGGAIRWKINGGPAAIIPFDVANTGINSFMSNNNNIWLPEGTAVSLIRQGTSSSQTVYFSILEFDVVP